MGSSKIEKIEAVIQALNEDIAVSQLCASCLDHLHCKISSLITECHIANFWVTLRCVRCERYEKELK